MTWLNWTAADKHAALRFQQVRLIDLMPVLRSAFLCLDSEHVLHVHSTRPENAKVLKWVWADIQEQAWIVLGVKRVCLWLGVDILVQSEFRIESMLILRNDIESSMTTTIAERPETITPAAEAEMLPGGNKIEKLPMGNKVEMLPTGNKLPGQTLAAIADSTEQPLETVRAWIAEQNWAIIPFNGQEIIAGDVAVQALDHFGAMLLQQRKAKLGLDTAALPTPVAPNGKAATAPKTAKAANPARSARSSISLPAGFATKVTRGAKANLERALPEKLQTRVGYLQEIVDQTERGKDFLERMASAVVKKNGGSKEKQIALLLEAAKKMQGEMQASSR